MSEPQFVPLPTRYDPGVPSEDAARAFYEVMSTRHSVREFSSRPVSRETIEWAVRTAGRAPSGANLQPWRFVCVQDPDRRRRIRAAAEEEERAFYERRASERWLRDLAPLGTDTVKEYLEIAPWLIAVFLVTKQSDGAPVYYGSESVGLAAGFLIAALHHAGLVALTHTPSPMAFLNKVLDRPPEERAFLLLPVGYPADDCRIPEHALQRKPLDEIMIVQ